MEDAGGARDQRCGMRPSSIDRDGVDDCGQMSAWFIFTAFAFYPVNPALGDYMGSPLFSAISLRLENEKTFRVLAKNNSTKMSTSSQPR